MTITGVRSRMSCRDDQREYVAPSAARYLLLSLREEVWRYLSVRRRTNRSAGPVGSVTDHCEAGSALIRWGGLFMQFA